MAKTCIRVEACNIGSSERHNLRSKGDIDELTKNKFSFYDRSGKFGDPFMNREYIELTPYQENNTTN